MNTLVNFNQLNYPHSYLGNTNFSIAGIGCLNTCLADATFDFGINIGPDEAAKKLGFIETGDYAGNLLWESLPNIGLKLIDRVRKWDDEAISKAYDALVAKQKVLLVLDQPNTALNHWVLVNMVFGPGVYEYRNPWGGTIGTIAHNSSTILGCAIVDRLDPVSAPANTDDSVMDETLEEAPWYQDGMNLLESLSVQSAPETQATIAQLGTILRRYDNVLTQTHVSIFDQIRQLKDELNNLKNNG